MSVITLRENISNYPKIYTRDNKSIKVRIDMGTVINEYPDGRGVIFWKYPDDGKLYLLDTSVEDNVYLVATLTQNELKESGYYKIQGEWSNDEYVIKDSPVYKMYVSQSIVTDGSDGQEIIIQPELIDDLIKIRDEVHADKEAIDQDIVVIQGLKEQIESIASDVSDIKDEVTEECNRIDGVYDEVVGIRDDMNTQYQSILGIEDNIELIQHDVENKQADIVIRQNDIIDRQNDVTAKQASVSSMKTDVQNLKNDVNNIKLEVLQSQADVQSRQSDVQNRQQNVIDRQNDIISRQHDIEVVQADVVVRESYVESIEEQVEAIAEQVHDDAQTNLHPPILGLNGNWFVWDNETDTYVDSGNRAAGGVYVGTQTPGQYFDIWIDTSDEN